MRLYESEPAVHLRPEILSLPAYKQGRPASAEAFKLSSNENPAPTPRWVDEAIAGATVGRYPESTSRTVRDRLADVWGCDAEEIIVGAGSVSVLYQLIQATSGPGDNIVFAWRAFEAYPWTAVVAGAEARRIPNRPDHSHDLDAMAAAIDDRTRVVMLCTPNNPTGTAITTEQFERFMTKVPPTVLVILDEAYAEFSNHPDTVRGEEQKGRYPNLVILRTFSKAWGLAGLRIGFAVGHRKILNAANSTAIPMVVTEQAQRAALAVLEHSDEALDIVRTIIDRRTDLWNALIEQGWSVPEPHGNFVWLSTGKNTDSAAQILESGGIVARVFSGEGIRVTVGEAESIPVLLAATARIVSANLHRDEPKG
jgi:histidinol-phosphate aminotransferase